MYELKYFVIRGLMRWNGMREELYINIKKCKQLGSKNSQEVSWGEEEEDLSKRLEKEWWSDWKKVRGAITNYVY